MNAKMLPPSSKERFESIDRFSHLCKGLFFPANYSIALERALLKCTPWENNGEYDEENSTTNGILLSVDSSLLGQEMQ